MNQTMFVISIIGFFGLQTPYEIIILKDKFLLNVRVKNERETNQG